MSMLIKQIGALAVASLTMPARPGFAQDTLACPAARLREGGLVVHDRQGVIRSGVSQKQEAPP